jgi:hypothetical protein
MLRNAHPAVVFVAMVVGYLLIDAAFDAVLGATAPLGSDLFEAVTFGVLFTAFTWFMSRDEPDAR